MNAFLLIFNDVGTNRQAITSFLDTRPLEVQNWTSCFTHGVIIISNKTAHDLQQLIHAQFPFTFFLVTRIEPQDYNSADGWMQKVIWDLINNPRPSLK